MNGEGRPHGTPNPTLTTREPDDSTPAGRLALRLVSVGFTEVRFVACDSHGYVREVLVDVGSSRRDWLHAVIFPSCLNASSVTLGDPELDQQVRIRAAKELVRLEAAVNVASGRWVA